MSLLKKLFGGSGAATPTAPEPVLYKGFAIFPDPIAEGKHYRLAARIEKEIAGELKIHRLIRADTLNSSDAAAEAAIQKSKVAIDQMGDQLFR
ncbi:HlyU family transcriptional regulator [Parasedimentitalea psychrophila]|uniref:HlyU family transcriptional regulator n=1 Tax=Parasedimentitalea psychrophila TaxID=2997337 RepID=A0A9Y2KWH8_9RHOB|nr:HlyU family transcriptional regulator [Parasedimentitalea psychrophila]WIY23828.1 HlyU family transcriptional regulator [Parasedimentitalea psychrophila]